MCLYGCNIIAGYVGADARLFLFSDVCRPLLDAADVMAYLEQHSITEQLSLHLRNIAAVYRMA